MKKWWIALAALALVLITSVALGEDGVCDKCATPMQKVSVSTLNEYYHTITWKCINETCDDYGKTSSETVPHSWRAANCIEPVKCSECGEISADEEAGIDPNNHVNYTVIGILNSPEFDEEGCHGVEGRCNDCKTFFIRVEPHTFGEWKPIEGGKQHKRSCICIVSETEYHSGGGATCTTEGKCEDCGASYYGSHDWSAWTKADENQHVSTCRNSGCNQTQSGEHTGGNATCSTEGTCAICLSPYKDSNNHTGSYTYAYAPSASSLNQHTVTETCTGCGKISRTYDEYHQLEPHDAQAPTCIAEGWKSYESCTHCTYSTYSAIKPDPNAHDLESHDAKEATCTEIGWDAYETCSRCDYSTYAEKPARSHWYGEWAPNADGTHSATCRRGCGCRKTVPCMLLTCQLQSDAPDTAFTLCPVCGEVSDGARLVLAEAAAKAVTGKLPAGEVAVRIGALAGGEQLMSVAFERGGELTRPTGRVKITLPAELLAGYTLSLLSEEGTETLLTDVQDGSFVLDFSGASSPVRVIRLVPAA